MEQKMEYHLAEINRAAELIVNYPHKILLFNAPMGAGKTTLISALCKALGMEENVSSPTFSLVNVYEGNSIRLYHYDLYRLKDPNELLDIGFEDYLSDETAFHCIEWPEKALPFIQNTYLNIHLEALADGVRRLKITPETPI